MRLRAVQRLLAPICHFQVTLADPQARRCRRIGRSAGEHLVKRIRVCASPLQLRRGGSMIGLVSAAAGFAAVPGMSTRGPHRTWRAFHHARRTGNGRPADQWVRLPRAGCQENRCFAWIAFGFPAHARGRYSHNEHPLPPTRAIKFNHAMAW